MRETIIAGNWKMNLTREEAYLLIKNVVAKLSGTIPPSMRIIFCVPYPYLEESARMLEMHHLIELGAQNIHQEASGAYTGEISGPMLTSVGAKYVIIGHSERREYFAEDNEQLARKVNAALSNGLTPIFCCGETKEIRESGNEVDFVTNQLTESLFHLPEENFRKLIIAYEPIWAIGTGLTATADQAQVMHKYIRNHIKEKYGEIVSSQCSIVYGGSMKPANAKELIACPDVDGGLIGGASLKEEDFVAIAQAAM